MREPTPASPQRRRLLLSLASTAALPLAACGAVPGREAFTPVPGDEGLPEAPPVEVPLATLVEGQPTTVQWGMVAVEVRKTPSRVEARALLCTHQGCRVSWEPATASYRCPCHGARFDPAGTPIAGPATRPLLRVPLLVSSTTVVVGGRPRE